MLLRRGALCHGAYGVGYLDDAGDGCLQHGNALIEDRDAWRVSSRFCLMMSRAFRHNIASLGSSEDCRDERVKGRVKGSDASL